MRGVSKKVGHEVIASGVCHYCQRGYFVLQVEHVIPISRGGTSARDNLVGACKSCNMEKLDFTPDEWRAYRVDQGLSWPPDYAGDIIAAREMQGDPLSADEAAWVRAWYGRLRPTGLVLTEDFTWVLAVTPYDDRLLSQTGGRADVA